MSSFSAGGTGLTSSEITANASAGTFVIDGTPTASGSASFTVNITDTVGATLSQGYTITVNSINQALTVMITQATGQADPTNSSPINFTVVFDEPVSDFATGDVTLSSSTTGGTLLGTVTNLSGDHETYNVAVSGMAGSGTVIASVAAGVAHDAAGNPNLASTYTDNSVIYDITAPTLTWGTPTLANAAGWNNTNVTIPFTVADALSGVLSSSVSSPLVLLAEGSNVTGTVTVTDKAGNSATFTSAAFKIDKTAPTLTWGTATTANAAGWNNTNVSVLYAATDGLSGVNTSLQSSPLVLSTEGNNVTGTVTVTDKAGNSATFTSAAFKIDKTAPTLTWGTATAANAAGWNDTNVTVPYTAADGLSGVNTSLPSNPLVLSAEGSNVTGTVTVTDIAGNSATFTSAAFKIDKTAPTVDLGHSHAAPNGAGWNNTNVSVPYTTADTLSGVSRQRAEQSAGVDDRRQQRHGHGDRDGHGRQQRHVHFGGVQDRQDGPDRDNQPGSGPSGPDRRFADQLYGGLQRTGHRFHHWRSYLSGTAPGQLVDR